MRIEWGKNNESITLFATGTCNEKHFDKLHLALIEKQVCDMRRYKSDITLIAAKAQKKMQEKCNEVVELKKKLDSKFFMDKILRFLGI